MIVLDQSRPAVYLLHQRRRPVLVRATAAYCGGGHVTARSVTWFVFIFNYALQPLTL